MGSTARYLRSIRHPSASGPGRWARSSTVLALLLFAGATGATLLSLPGTAAFPHLGPVGGPLLPVGPATVSGPTLSLANATVASSASIGFWGANVRPYYYLGAAEGAAFTSSGLEFVRWPGGAVVDRLNVSANLIYDDNGSSFSPPTSISVFAQWCASVSCRAIVGVPAEINDPATAAYYVQYIEHTVGFTPAFWEIGNEPAVWTHFSIPWSHWTEAQATNATPAPFADLLHRYIAAIRAVDPYAQFVGMGGLGTGAWGETTWIQAAVSENGPNLSALSIHVYPAGGSIPMNTTDRTFYDTLTGNSALSVRVPGDRAAIRSACPTCHIELIATELGSGTDGGPFDPYMTGFQVIPYLGAEFVQALSLNLSQVDLFSFEGSYDGSILNETGAVTAAATLFEQFLAPLRSQVLGTNLTDPVRGIWVLATRSSIGGGATVLIVNTNVTSGLNVQLRVPGGFADPGYFTAWSGAGGPTTTAWATTPPGSYHLAPESVGLVVLNGGIVFQRPLPTTPTPVVGIALAAPPATVSGVLGLAAPTSLTFPCWAVARARRDRTD